MQITYFVALFFFVDSVEFVYFEEVSLIFDWAVTLISHFGTLLIRRPSQLLEFLHSESFELFIEVVTVLKWRSKSKLLRWKSECQWLCPPNVSFDKKGVISFAFH